MVGIFSRFIFNNAIFNTDGGVNPDTHDGADGDTYKRYRKRLEKLAKLSDKHLKSKYVKEAVKIAQIAETLPIESPVIKEIAHSVSLKQDIPEIDLSSLQAEIARLILYMELILADQEQEDELILLMCV